jgi:hypothetical protein
LNGNKNIEFKKQEEEKLHLTHAPSEGKKKQVWQKYVQVFFFGGESS